MEKIKTYVVDKGGKKQQLSALDGTLEIFESIVSDCQVYFSDSEKNNITCIYGMLEDGIEGYNIYDKGILVHSNHSGKFVDNDLAKKNIANDMSPIVEDATHWIENNYCDVETMYSRF